MTLLRRCALPVAALALALSASPASASTVVLSDGLNLQIGGDDQGNVLNVTPNQFVAGKLRVTDLSKPLMLISGCALAGAPNVADCIAAPNIVALLGGGSDILTVNAFVPLLAGGQTGNDQVTGGSADDTLEGNGGDDIVNGDGGNDSVSDGDRTDPATGAGGNDTLLGGAGNDYIDAGPLPGGGAGADTLDGQPGNDTVDYSRRTAPVAVTEGIGADDGESGEGDNVVNAETILGGSGSDSLTGAAEANTISGGRGD